MSKTKTKKKRKEDEGRKEGGKGRKEDLHHFVPRVILEAVEVVFLVLDAVDLVLVEVEGVGRGQKHKLVHVKERSLVDLCVVRHVGRTATAAAAPVFAAPATTPIGTAIMGG